MKRKRQDPSVRLASMLLRPTLYRLVLAFVGKEEAVDHMLLVSRWCYRISECMYADVFRLICRWNVYLSRRMLTRLRFATVFPEDMHAFQTKRHSSLNIWALRIMGDHTDNVHLAPLRNVNTIYCEDVPTNQKVMDWLLRSDATVIQVDVTGSMVLTSEMNKPNRAILCSTSNQISNKIRSEIRKAFVKPSVSVTNAHVPLPSRGVHCRWVPRFFNFSDQLLYKRSHGNIGNPGTTR